MKVIIVGAGVIGRNLAKSLSDENHEVYLVEREELVAGKADENLDVKVITGDGADPDTLKEAGIKDADLVIAMTRSDETNLVVCSLAAAFGAKQRIARVRNKALIRALDELGHEKFYINEIINPEGISAQAIVQAVTTPGAREVFDFAEGRILLRAFDIPEGSPLCGVKIGDLREEDFPWPFLIVAMIRNKKVVIPKGDTILTAKERIYVLLPPASAGEFLTFINPDVHKNNKVVIFGASGAGEQVAKSLSSKVADIILLEEDMALAEDVAGRLENVRIIHGSATEADILKESGIEAADVFIATSRNDHMNLVSAVLAKKMGAKTTIIMTEQPDYMTIIGALNIDVVINPRILAADQILRLVRGKGVKAVSKLLEYDAEALELTPEQGSEITRGPLKNINFPRNVIVGAVCRGKEVELARGDTSIQAGDRVIVFCQQSAVKKFQELFTHKKFF